MADRDYDFVIIGSGFGGSTAGLRLVDKGYRVLMLEKGSELKAADFPKTNWNLKRWMWLPIAGFRGMFKMTFFRHVTILSGVGVGGGSLTYACTHPVPKASFFGAESWSHLANWEQELRPHYAEAKRMLGVTQNPALTQADRVLQQVATGRGEPDAYEPTDVAIYFGKPGETVEDPYFDGKGPSRTGCIRCGGCMLGCRHNAKNSLDKNYLHLALAGGLKLEADTEVTAVRPLDGGGYRIEAKQGKFPWLRRKLEFTTERVVFSGGVLGTVDLLLRMKDDPNGLPKLSPQVGASIRTNSEALIGVITPDRGYDMSKGIAIGSIYQTDPQSHVEVVRYSRGSGFFRLLMAPLSSGDTPITRIARTVSLLIRHPIKILKAAIVGDMAKQTSILLYMRTFEGTLKLRRGWHGKMTTARGQGEVPTANMPEAHELAHAYADEVDGTPFTLMTETLFNIPTTAHILGGACMGDSDKTGVIDADHRVHGYDGLYVMDGAAVSANPGVNPSLTIVAMTERACSKIPARSDRAGRDTPVAASA